MENVITLSKLIGLLLLLFTVKGGGGSLLSWEVSQPPPYAQKFQPTPVVSSGSSKKPLLIVEASLKIRYFDCKERSYSISIYNSMVSCGIRN